MGLAAVATLLLGACSLIDLDGLSSGEGEGESDSSLDVLSADASSESTADAQRICASRAPSCAPETCVLRTLFTPAVASSPWDVATDRDHVFWVEQRSVDGGVGDRTKGTAQAFVSRTRREVDAGEPQELATEPASSNGTTKLSVIGPFVYWWTWTSGPGTIIKRVKTDCAVPCSVETVNGPGSISQPVRAIAPAQGNDLFVVMSQSVTSEQVLLRVTPNGAVTTLASLGPAFALGSAGLQGGVIATETALFATGPTNSTLTRISLDGKEIDSATRPSPREWETWATRARAWACPLRTARPSSPYAGSPRARIAPSSRAD